MAWSDKARAAAAAARKRRSATLYSGKGARIDRQQMAGRLRAARKGVLKLGGAPKTPKPLKNRAAIYKIATTGYGGIKLHTTAKTFRGK